MGPRLFIFLFVLFSGLAVGSLLTAERLLQWQIPLGPAKLSVIEYETDRYGLVTPATPEGQAILNHAYGPYASVLATGRYLLSYSEEAEFTLPRIDTGSRRVLLREAPGLRLNLWQERPPQVVMLGSSMFFMGMNRQRFFDATNNQVRLIDFTMGNNNPGVADFLLDRLSDASLRIEPGTLVLYGFGNYEFDQRFCAPIAEHITRAFGQVAGQQPTKTLRERFEGAVQLSNFRAHLIKVVETSFVQRVVLGRRDPLIVPAAIVADVDGLRAWGMSTVVPGLLLNTPALCGEAVEAMRRVIGRLSEAGADVVLVRLPMASPVRYAERLPGREQEIADTALAQLASTGLRFRLVDLEDPATLGADDRDYVIGPTRYWDVGHLNWDGGLKLTDYLLRQVILPHVAAAPPGQ